MNKNTKASFRVFFSFEKYNGNWYSNSVSCVRISTHKTLNINERNHALFASLTNVAKISKIFRNNKAQKIQFSCEMPHTRICTGRE